MTAVEGNTAIAFALVLGAGASTGLGAAVVFFPSLVKLASRRVLAASLGFSAGVMSYVSFVEIFNKATLSFIQAGHAENTAYIYSTCCFFGGVLSMMLVNVAVHSLVGGKHHHDHPDDFEHGPKKKSSRASVDKNIDEDVATQPCCSSDPVRQLRTFQQMASVLEHEQHDHDNDEDRAHDGAVTDTEIPEDSQSCTVGKGLEERDCEEVKIDSNRKEDDLEGTGEDEGEDKHDDKTTAAASDEMQDENSEANKKLQKMGLNTALAIGLHNFPEGLATFVAALKDPAVGAVLAVAIAIHNIPEGLCVALPIYYATGKRLKAFLWAVLSGASEVVAAFLGWLILANVFSDNAYAILFGLVAGMMVIISVKELLPTAHQYDPDDTVVTYCFIGGMSLMALSLVLFQI